MLVSASMIVAKHRGRPRGQGAPRSKVIAADIARRLSSNEWAVGQSLPSCRQLAKAYGVGLKTIQLAFKALKSEGKIAISARRQPVVALGAAIDSILNGAIVLVTTSHQGLNLSGEKTAPECILQGILKWQPDGFTGTFIALQDGNRWRIEYPVGLRELAIRGILLLGPFPDHLLKRYEGMSHPVVLLDQPGDKYKIHSVAVANYDAAFNATSRLIALGHRRIAFLRYPVNRIQDIDPDARERQQGFVSACEKAGLKEGSFQVFTSGFHSANAAFQQILHSKPRFTAVVAAAPESAVHLRKVAKANGLSVPGDLTIITFASKGNSWSGPQIDFEEIGREGRKILLHPPRTIEHIRIPTVWNDGSSCGPPG
jgi:hypothetical protein